MFQQNRYTFLKYNIDNVGKRMLFTFVQSGYPEIIAVLLSPWIDNGSPRVRTAPPVAGPDNTLNAENELCARLSNKNKNAIFILAAALTRLTCWRGRVKRLYTTKTKHGPQAEGTFSGKCGVLRGDG